MNFIVGAFEPGAGVGSGRRRRGWAGRGDPVHARIPFGIEVRMANSTLHTNGIPCSGLNSELTEKFRAFGRWNRGKEISGEEMGVSRDAGCGRRGCG